jgi:hypothetical protein
MIHPRPKPLSSYPAHEKNSLEQIPIITYELGDLAKMFVYAQRYAWVDKEKSRGYRLEAKIAASDVIAQMVVMCEREGWNFWEVKRLGEERFREKIERHRKHGE